MKNSLYALLLLLVITSCKEKSEKEIKYKKDTKDVLFYENDGIKNKSAKNLFREGLENVENENFELAKEKFVEADKLESRNPIILNAIAQAEIRLGNTEKSNEISLNIISIDSTYTATYINLGQNYMSSRDYEKAKEILLKGKKFATSKNLHLKSILLVNLAIAYNNLGDYENGLKYSIEALENSQDEKLTDFANKVKMESEENCNLK